MSDAVHETFALARRGLPLPAPTHAPLRAAWLPPAARNLVTATPALAMAAELPPQPAEHSDDEPWWMEASEWVQRDEAKDTPAATSTSPSGTPASAGGNPAVRHDAEAASDLPRRAMTGAQPDSTVTPPRSANPAPGSISAREAQRATLPSAANDVGRAYPSAATVAPVALSPRLGATGADEAFAQPPRPSEGITTEMRVAPPSPSAPKPTVATQAHAPVTSRNIALDASVMHSITAVAGPGPDDPAATVFARDTASAADLARSTAPAERVGHTPRVPVPAATSPMSASDSAESSASKREASARAAQAKDAVAVPRMQAAVPLHAMGALRSTTRQAWGLAPQVDMAALLAPRPKREAQVHIGRVVVTVQAPPSAMTQAAAPAQAAAAARTAAPAHPFRNPWSGYHARRD